MPKIDVAEEALETERKFREWQESVQQYADEVAEGIENADDPNEYLAKLAEWNEAMRLRDNAVH